MGSGSVGLVGLLLLLVPSSSVEYVDAKLGTAEWRVDELVELVEGDGGGGRRCGERMVVDARLV